MMTIVQLRQHVGQQIGLPASFDGSIAAYRGLPAAQQIELTQGMIAYVRANPGSFTAAQVETATVEAGRAANMTPQDTSFDAGEFFAEFELNAKRIVADPLVAIGQGVSTSVSLVGTILPVLAIIGIIVFALPYINKARLSSP